MVSALVMGMAGVFGAPIGGMLFAIELSTT
jgi:H+/Cl- antiporter ClcA